jgi:hypothetical protein
MNADTKAGTPGGRIFIDSGGSLNISPSGWGTTPINCQFDLSVSFIAMG